MFLRTEFIKERLFIGMGLTMSLTSDRTYELWSTTKPRLVDVPNRLSSDYFSLQEYPSLEYFKEFSFNNEFKKYALVEVERFNSFDLEEMVIADTLYAVFLHKGTSREFPMTMNYIMSEWLPKSEYELAHAPHFEVLGKGYKKENPDSQEEVWIPIVKKTI